MRIKPLHALRPAKEYAEKIASKPYDVLNTEEARQETKDNPYSFLHIVRSEVDLDASIDPYDERVYEKARENLDLFEEKGWLKKDPVESYYLYRQIMGNHEQYGLVAAISIDDYWSGKIKIHELTREKKEKDRITHVMTTRANTGPVFLTYRSSDEIDSLLELETKKEPEYDFYDEYNIRHTAWLIQSGDAKDKITRAFSEIPVAYVADGHHRSKSAAETGKKLREQNADFTGEEGFNYFLCVLFPHNQLKILDYNRVVATLAGKTPQEILTYLKQYFDVNQAANHEQAKPLQKGLFGMYLDNQWYTLKIKDSFVQKNNPVHSLDISILQNLVLDPVFGIKDPRTDESIDFVGGIRGLEELEKRVQSGEMKIAFALHPVSIDELMNIADAGLIMPPKSTWFEPKLRSGLFIHRI